uniref:tRNA (adenine(58)-N(1))-methyltransferase catalytic subunit TRM61 C-terminal domain-containing protein n=1 Tax=Anopheles melas TaxID=34690 RepID=A0A182U140_9DIPT
MWNDVRGRICSFSPCIEQSMRVCEALGKCGFIEVQNIEVLQVEDCVRTRNVPVMELDFLKTKGNSWKGINGLNRRARPVSMMGETAGHNPFNTFPGMEQYGNCIEVYVSLVYITINITIVCGSGRGIMSNEEEPYPSQLRQPHCPVYTSNVKWPIENLVYLEYDVRRFELSSCVPLNETHSYHGHLLLTDDIETRAYMHRAQLPMWRQKLQQTGTVPFQFEGNCSECNFRNEYITLVPRVRLDKDEPPLEAEPYCTDGQLGAQKPPLSHITMMLNGATLDLMMKLLIPAAMLFGGVLLFRFCICNKKSTKATVAPMVAHSSEKA